MALTRPCLDCGALTNASRCAVCQQSRDYVRNRGAAQRARLSISRAQRQRVYQRDGHRCVDCCSPFDLTLDHLVPLAHEVKRSCRDDELATRCRRCNSAKGDWPLPP
jgi:5-methylcytosine-specific restriction endonuclease McrA